MNFSVTIPMGSDMFNDSVSFPVFMRPNLTYKEHTHNSTFYSLTFISLKKPELTRMVKTREEK